MMSVYSHDLSIIDTSGADMCAQNAVEDLLSGNSPRPCGEWWVIHSKARQEKIIAQHLTARGIICYLPLVRRLRRNGRGKIAAELPLFPSYLFFFGEQGERYTTLMTHRVANVIRATDQSRLEHELWQVYQATQSEHAVDLYPALKRGRRCRIVRGALRGVEGVVVNRRGLWRVYLGIEMLGQSAELEIDPSDLEVID